MILMSFFSIWPLSIVVDSSHNFEFSLDTIFDLESNHSFEINLTNRKFKSIRLSDDFLILASLQPLSPLCFEDHALETVELFPAIFNFEKPSPIELLNIVENSKKELFCIPNSGVEAISDFQNDPESFSRPPAEAPRPLQEPVFSHAERLQNALCIIQTG